MASKTWTAVDFDAAKVLKGQLKKLKVVEAPQTVDLQVVTELDEAPYKVLAKNPSWLAKLQGKAADEAHDAIKAGAKLLEEADKDAESLDKKEAEALTREIQGKIKTMFEDATKDMAKVAGKLVDDSVKADKSLTSYKRKACGKIALTALTVGGGAALTVVTGGTLSPIAWISIVRGGITVLKELDQLASDADSVAILIRKELTFLDKWLVDNIDTETKKGKLQKGAREVGLNLLSKALDLNLPSVKTCEEHIALHEKNITKLERKSKELSETIYAAMDKQEQWAKEFDKVKNDNGASAAKTRTNLKNAEVALNTLLERTIDINKSIDEAQKEHVAFEKAFTALEDGLPGFTKYVDSAVSLGVDLCSGVRDASSAIEKALSVVSALAQTAADEKLTARK